MSDLVSVLETVPLEGESVAFHLTRKNGRLPGMGIPQLSDNKGAKPAMTEIADIRRSQA